MPPVRIQRRRSKGWKMPENTVYVGRPTRWGNPFKVGAYIEGLAFVPGTVIEHIDGKIMHRMGAAECVRRYAEMMAPYRHHGPTSSPEHFYISIAMMQEIQHTLRGKNLACFCPLDQPCHADWLLKVANDDPIIK